MMVLTNDQIRETAPSVFATQPYLDRSERYRFVPTSGVVEALRDRGFFPVRATQSKARIEGKKEYTKHVLRFRRMGDLTQQAGEVPEVVLSNSHDGTSSYVLMLGIFRIVCSNGLVVASSMFNEIRVRHSGSPDLPQEVADASYQVIKEAPKVISTIDDWKKVLLSDRQQLAFADAALQLRDSAIEVQAESLLRPRRYADNEPTLWHTYNRIQENMIKGGNRGRNVKGNFVHTRRVNSVTEDLRINRALWQLTEKMKELATSN